MRQKNITNGSVLVRLAALSTLLWISGALAEVHIYPFDNEVDSLRFQSLLGELRCPKCQNQSLSDSDAPIAEDLRAKVHELIKDGRSDQEIRQYLIDRYGQFITYRPPLKASTWLLWLGPALILAVSLAMAFLLVRKNQMRASESKKGESL